MSTRTLDTGWKVREFMPGARVDAGAQLAEFPDDAWLGIAVPGDVHQASRPAYPRPVLRSQRDGVRVDGGAGVVVRVYADLYWP